MSYFNCQVDGIQHRYPCEAHPTHPFNKNAKLGVQVKYSSTYENGGNGTSYFYGRLLALFSVSQSTMGVNQFCILFFFLISFVIIVVHTHSGCTKQKAKEKNLKKNNKNNQRGSLGNEDLQRGTISGNHTAQSRSHQLEKLNNREFLSLFLLFFHFQVPHGR